MPFTLRIRSVRNASLNGSLFSSTCQRSRYKTSIVKRLNTFRTVASSELPSVVTMTTAVTPITIPKSDSSVRILLTLKFRSALIKSSNIHSVFALVIFQLIAFGNARSDFYKTVNIGFYGNFGLFRFFVADNVHEGFALFITDCILRYR